MVRVPTWEKKVEKRTPAPAAAPRVAGVPPEAFGMGVSQANQGLSATAGRVADIVAKRMLDREQEEAEKQVFEADTRFRQDMDKALYDATPDENGRPKGIMARTLGAAKGATVDLDTTFSAMKKQYLEGLQNPRQAAALSKLMDTHFSQVRGEVIRHESRQFQEDYKSTVEANIKQRVAQAATLTSPADLSESLEQAKIIQTAALKRQGTLDEVSISQANGQLATDFTLSYLKGSLETDPAAARRSLETLKPALPADVYGQVEGKVIEADFNNTLQKYRLMGGAMPGAVKMAEDQRYSRTDMERAERLSAVKRAYAETDYSTYNSLWQGTQEKTVNTIDIDSAFNEGKLNQGDAEALRKELFRINSGAGALPPATKLTLDNLKLKAEETWGNQKDGQVKKVEQFEYIMKQEALKTTDPNVLYKKGLDMMKDVQVPTKHWWQNDDFPAYKVELEGQRAESLVKADYADSLQNAITTLKKNGRAVTPESVAAVLKVYPDGIEK